MKLLYLITVFSMLLFSACTKKSENRTLYIIGDSTVKNGQGDGAGGLWGWGDFIPQLVDTAKIKVANHARGGTSSRTFRTLGLWAPVLEQIKPGDYVFIQFGHNDSSNINDESRARGTINGTGNETEEIDNLLTHEHEIVHTYGWYIRQYITEIKSKGGIPVIFSPIPRNNWSEGKLPRNNINSYGMWAQQVAEEEKVTFIDLNNEFATALEEIGEQNVTGSYFFEHDHTHTSAKGAALAATIVANEVRKADELKIAKYFPTNKQTVLPEPIRVFLVGDSTVANGKETIIGWGKMLPKFFIEQCVTIINKARGGRSSRSYRFEGLWAEVEEQLQPGDFVIFQFGHNDSGNIDKEKFRGSLTGIGNDSLVISRPDSTQETVHTYGWYMQQYINETKAKGATPIVISQVTRNRWNNGKVERVNDSYGLWSKQVAEKEGALFIDINNIIADKYEEMGKDEVKKFFTNDHTHTNETGALFNAGVIAGELYKCKNIDLRKYIVFNE